MLIVKYAKDQRYDEKGIATHCGQVLHLYIAHNSFAVQYTLTGTAPVHHSPTASLYNTHYTLTGTAPVHHSQLPHSRFSRPLLLTGWPSCRRGRGEGCTVHTARYCSIPVHHSFGRAAVEGQVRLYSTLCQAQMLYLYITVLAESQERARLGDRAVNSEEI